MKTIQVFAIKYYNGEHYDDAWSGISVGCGIFATRELAEEKIKRLQIAHDQRIKEEIEAGYVFPNNENETWQVVPIDFHSHKAEEKMYTKEEVRKLTKDAWVQGHYNPTTPEFEDWFEQNVK